MVVLPNCRLSRAERGPFSPAVSSAACLYPLTRTAHHLYLLTLDIYISTTRSRYLHIYSYLQGALAIHFQDPRNQLCLLC